MVNRWVKTLRTRAIPPLLSQTLRKDQDFTLVETLVPQRKELSQFHSSSLGVAQICDFLVQMAATILLLLSSRQIEILVYPTSLLLHRTKFLPLLTTNFSCSNDDFFRYE